MFLSFNDGINFSQWIDHLPNFFPNFGCYSFNFWVAVGTAEARFFSFLPLLLTFFSLQPSSGAQVSLLSVTSFAHPYRSAPVCKKENSANLASEHIYIRPPNIHKSMEWQLWQKIKHTHKQLVCKKEFQSRSLRTSSRACADRTFCCLCCIRPGKKKEKKSGNSHVSGNFWQE